MKKILGMLSIFLGIGFVLCLIFGLVFPVSEQIPSDLRFIYKFCNGMEYFLFFLPAVVFTGVIVSCSVYFGHNDEGSKNSFSAAMMKRYKSVLITGLLCSFLLTLSNETLGILLEQKKVKIMNRQKILQEYIDAGNALFNEGLYKRSQSYAKAVLKLDPNSSEARDLINRTDMEINRSYIDDLRFDLENAEPIQFSDDSLKINEQNIYDAYKCLLKATSAFDNAQWFDAHYYAEMGIKLASSKDPNVQKLKDISAESWNNLTELHSISKTEVQEIFNQKYKGFVALMEDDDLQAYYIFRYLDETYPELKKDNDVQFYFNVARERVEQKYFFIDETFELETFEDVNDVYFSFVHQDGTKDIVYFKGMTNLKSSGSSVQYLRDFTILKSQNGKWCSTMHVPYAKVMPVSVKNLNKATKTMLGISDDADFVPYILLKSIGRDNSGQMNVPEYTYANGDKNNLPEYMIYPIAFSDFLLLEKTASKPENLPLSVLFSLNSEADAYGFSSETYSHTLLNRLLYPLFVLCLVILLSVFGWNYRIGETLYFRMSWVFSFPFFIAIMFIFYYLFVYIFKLINYAIVELFAAKYVLLAGIILYTILLLFSSLYFLSRKSKN